MGPNAIVYFMCALAILRGLFELLFYYFKEKKYYRVNGVVVENYLDQHKFYHAGYNHYYPIIKFTDKNGITKQLTSNLYNADRPLYKVGTKVKLLLSPEDSDRFVIDEKVDARYIPLIWIGIGTAGAIFVFFFFR